MLDIRRIRTDFDNVLAGLNRRGDSSLEADLRRALGSDERLRAIVAERDELRSQINALSKQVGALHREKRADEAAVLQEQSRVLGERERTLAAEYDSIAVLLRETLLGIPNVPSDDAPLGGGPDDNPVLKTVGYDPSSYGAHQRVPHWEIGAELGLLDAERASKLSGSMFVLYRGMGARLLRAMTQLALDRHTTGEGAYEELRPPSLVRTETMTATGQLPKFADDAYNLERDDLWLIPTAEAPLTSMHRDEILDEADLPVRFTAYTPCFRREAGAAGRDTRGTLRSHEFDKVELFAYCTPDQAAGVHADILARAEDIVSDLGLAYRIVDLCTGDLGFSSARTFDIEVYAPGTDAWLEVSSVSWFGDYQARRANVRYRPTGGKGTETCHTLNGSAMAWSRIWPAVLETHRQPDGSIELPKVLHPYLGGTTSISRG
ncbi:MAG TPA: serine--tRNA ligase [Acidimicrobiales bacterium]|nr:serine--tRNA ligase [Acidimicrobiales bacterium]